jgi:predicted DNA-binding transcriptional regulator AlpA
MFKGIKLMTAQELADFLGLQVQTIYNRTQRHARDPFPIKWIKVGRRLMFHPDEVQKFIDQGGEVAN